jgi:tetraacyldisaccharide 4'-kinase
MPSAISGPPPSRSPWQLLYAALLRRRRRLWAARASRLARPVVSIGNLHWGGGGKTPLVMAVAAHARDQGRKVAILSRGYRSRGRGIRLVSDGSGPRLDPVLAGDEPFLMARDLPGVAVLVGADRYAAGLHALQALEPAPDLFILDDGFSHLGLARDLDILVFPAADPFAGGRLAPGGRLREPLSSATLADAVVLTGVDAAAGSSRSGDGLGGELAAALSPYGYQGPAFASATVAGRARFDDGRPLEAPARVIAVSGIARPSSFHRMVASAGFETVAELALGDHHDYPEATLAEIRRLWSEHRADAVLTTSKDHVKLAGRLDLPLAELPVEARPEEGFWSWLDGRLSELG